MKLVKFVAINRNYVQIFWKGQLKLSARLYNFGIDNETSRGIMEIGLIRWLAC